MLNNANGIIPYFELFLLDYLLNSDDKVMCCTGLILLYR